MVDVAVITINYNASSYTLKCLNSILKNTSGKIDFQMIVVDNNSEISDYRALKAGFPKDHRCSLYRSTINTGFGGGNMYGTRYANAKYLLFLNNDALLLNDCLSILHAFMEAHPKTGLGTAQNFDQDNSLVPSFDHNKGFRRLVLGRGFLEKTDPSRYPERDKEYFEPIKVDWVNGAFMFFRTEAFLKIDGFDTNIFLYWEEMDCCHRLRKNGYNVMLVPEAKILHYQGVSIGKSKAINKEAYLSYLYVIRKNFGIVKLFGIQLYLTLVFLLKPKKWYLLSTIWQGGSMKKSMRNNQTARHHEE